MLGRGPFAYFFKNVDQMGNLIRLENTLNTHIVKLFSPFNNASCDRNISKSNCFAAVSSSTMLLGKVVQKLDQIPMDDRETKGDV